MPIIYSTPALTWNLSQYADLPKNSIAELATWVTKPDVRFGLRRVGIKGFVKDEDSSMRVECPGFGSFAELKNYVHERLCELEQLDVQCFPVSLQAIKRGEQLCGYLFSILGPRSVVFNAIFETDSNAIHFYNSAGERVVSEQVQNAPSIP